MPKIIADEELKTLIADTKKQKIYDEEVRPLLDQLKVMCTRYGFPFFVTICIDHKHRLNIKKQTEKTLFQMLSRNTKVHTNIHL